MNISFFIALRYLQSRRNRGFISFLTIIATAGVSLGVAALIIALSVLSGFEKTIKENIISFTAHIQVVGFQNQLLPTDSSRIHSSLERHPEIRTMAPFLSREGIIRSEENSDGVVIKGVDPDNDISPASTRLVEGAAPLRRHDAGIEGMIISKRLAEKLNCSLGSRLILFSLGGSSLSLSQTRVMQFEVRGIYETGMAEYDEIYVYIHLLNAQRLFGVGKMISGYDILLSDPSKTKQLAIILPEELGYPHFARTTEQMNRNLYTWIELQKKPIPIIIGLIAIVASVNVIGTLLMMIIEKTKEIGILRALGTNKKKITKIFLLQGMVVGIVGTAIGNILALSLCWLELHYKIISLPQGIYYMTHVPIELNWANFVIVSAVSIVMCFFASVIPSRIAGRKDPVQSLRFG
ncbi:MAG: ABC transporter permease [bacterium]